MGRYLNREIAEINSWRPIVIKLGIRVPQCVLFDLSVSLATCSYIHDVTNVTMSPAIYETHTLSTAVNLTDKGANKLQNIPE